MDYRGFASPAKSRHVNTAKNGAPKYNDNEVFIYTALDLAIIDGTGRNRALNRAKELLSGIENSEKYFMKSPKYKFSKEFIIIFKNTKIT